MILSNADIVAKLKAEGFTFKRLELDGGGDYDVADADWNYRDLLHLGPVHATECTILSTYDDSTVQILWPRMFGIRLPMQLMSYRPAPNKHAAISIWLFFALTSEDTFVRLGENKTRVETRYSVGAPKWLSFLLPAITFLLKRSYKKLMSEDIPMRKRRGLLRSWGYHFKYDNKYSFQLGSSLKEDELVLPTNPSNSLPDTLIRVDRLEEGDTKLGRSDHLGLRLHKKKGELSFFPRVCAHAGASLDDAPCSTSLKCPWHSKVFRPLATFKLNSTEAQQARTQYHQIELKNGKLFIKAVQPTHHPEAPAKPLPLAA